MECLKPEITHLTKPRPERLDLRPEKVRLSESAKKKKKKIGKKYFTKSEIHF